MDLRAPSVAPQSQTQNRGGIVQVNQQLRSAVNFFSPKCSLCKTKGEIVYVGWQQVASERAYGMVTRQETQEIRKRDTRGRAYTQQSVSSRQERVPVVRTTFRYHYRCGACKGTWYRDTVTQQEDFSVASQQQPVTRENNTVYTREVVKIPCRYCSRLIDPVRDQQCPSCGANLSMGR